MAKSFRSFLTASPPSSAADDVREALPHAIQSLKAQLDEIEELRQKHAADSALIRAVVLEHVPDAVVSDSTRVTWRDQKPSIERVLNFAHPAIPDAAISIIGSLRTGTSGGAAARFIAICKALQ